MVSPFRPWSELNSTNDQPPNNFFACSPEHPVRSHRPEPGPWLASAFPALTATLAPGDVLYIPPLWWHQLTSIGSAVSVSVWTKPHYIEALEILLAGEGEAFPLSDPGDPSPGTTLRVFGFNLFEALGEDGGEDGDRGFAWPSLESFLARFVLPTRFAHLPTLRPARG